MEQELDRKRQFLINAAYYALILGIIYVMFRYVIYYVTPFIVAGLITLALKRPVERLSRSFNISRRGAAGIVVLVFYVLVSLVATWIFIHVLWSMFQWLGALPVRYASSIEPAIQNVLDWYEHKLESLSINQTDYLHQLSIDLLGKISEIIYHLSQHALRVAQSLVLSIPKAIIGVLFCIIATLFMSMDYPAIRHFILGQFRYEHQCMLLESKQYIVKTFGRIFMSYGAIMFITMTELYMGFVIIGVEDAMVLSMLIALFDILPALGTGGILIPWAVLEMIKENYTLATQLLVLYGIVTVVRQFLEPKIVGENIGLHPLIMLMSIFIGASLFGPLGILIMPFMLIVIKRLNDTGRISVFRSAYASDAENPGFFERRRRAKEEREEGQPNETVQTERQKNKETENKNE